MTKTFVDNAGSVVAFGNGKIGFTKQGGIAIRLTNKTGAASVKGSLVAVHTTVDNAVALTAADSATCFGIVYDTGIADGSECWVVTYGIAQVLLKNATASVAGNWVVPSSDTIGRADATATTIPAGGQLADHELHFREIGHCLEDNAGGTDQLVNCNLHFN